MVQGIPQVIFLKIRQAFLFLRERKSSSLFLMPVMQKLTFI